MTQQLATLDDLERLGPPAMALAGIAPDVRTTHLVAASGIALSYAAKRATLPLVSWGDDLRGAVVAIAVFTVLKSRGFKPGGELDQTVVKAHDDAIFWLRDVAKGLAELVDLVDATPAIVEAGPLVSCGEVHFRWPRSDRWAD